MESQTTGLRPMEMHPYPRLRRYFPRRGKFALCSAFGLIQYEQHFGELATSGGLSPFGAYGTTFPPQKQWDNPPQGTISPKSISMHSVARISPAGGGAAAGDRRGAFPSLAGRLACFPFARRAVVWFYHKGAPSFSRAPITAFSPERSDATLLYNPWHRGPEGPMDAIRPSAPKAQAPSGIQPPRSWPHARPQPVGPSTLRPKRPLNLIYYNFPHKKRSRQSSFFFQFYF